VAAKLDARRLAEFLAAPPAACRLVLLIGDDAGLITERAQALVQAVSGGDALCVVEVGRELQRQPAALADAAAAPRR
jgi:DNA polymerase III subunit delta